MSRPRREPQWPDVVAVVLGLLALCAALCVFLAFMRADW